MKIEEYYATLKNGSCGKLFFSKESYQNIEEVLSSNPVYGCSLGTSIYLDKLPKEYSEEEMEKAGYSRLVRVEKTTTTIKRETIFIVK